MGKGASGSVLIKVVTGLSRLGGGVKSKAASLCVGILSGAVFVLRRCSSVGGHGLNHSLRRRLKPGLLCCWPVERLSMTVSTRC